MPKIHHAAAKGYSKGTSTYLAGRPSYPEALKTWLKQNLQLTPDQSALELGAGTGKFTKLLATTGAAIIALEPIEAMRKQIENTVPGTRSIAGSAEATPLPDESVDAVICAQAFHWFANATAITEIHRVLKPGGKLGLVWNVRDESVDWVAKLSEIMAPYEAGAPRYHTGQWRTLFPADGFGALQESQFPNVHTGAPEQVIVERVLSISFIASLPTKEREKIAEKVRTVIISTPALAGKETVSFPYTTVAFCCTKQAL